jgi:hypothetical protein
VCIHCHWNVFTEPLPGNDKGPWKAAELLEVMVSLQPNPNSYKENNSAQDRCHSVQGPETLKTSFLVPLFQLSEFRGDIQQTKIISESGVDSSSSEQGPVVGYRIQSNELLGFIEYRTFLIT